MQSPNDIESQWDRVDIDSVHNEPLLLKSSHTSVKSLRHIRSPGIIELDDIPPIIKSKNGNVFWADEACCRRIGLTSTEARLLLKLLQTEQPESYNYEEYTQYRSMFADFEAEHARLQKLIKELPWWNLDKYHQRAIWNARIEWLRRMDRAHALLLYLMSRRRMILTKATRVVKAALKEKRIIRIANEVQTRGRVPTPQCPTPQEEFLGTMTFGDTAPTAIESLGNPQDRPAPLPVQGQNMRTRGATHSTSRSHSSDAGKLSSLGHRLRDSLSHSRRRSSQDRSRCSGGRCPVFDETPKATREEIKKLVETIMPHQTPYIVIGWFNRLANDPDEQVLLFQRPDDLFQALRNGEVNVRGTKKYFSLKGLRGFGLYKCDVSRGAHLSLALTASQEAVMSQLFLAYKASHRHPDPDVARAWQGWVHKNLNNSKNNPLEGRYSIQLMYDWSSYRLTTVVAIPLLLSLAIGFWYMAAHADDPDVITTAWTISLYIVTAAAALIALLAIVGGLKDV